MTVIKAAAVQLSPVLYSREGTAERFTAGQNPKPPATKTAPFA